MPRIERRALIVGSGAAAGLVALAAVSPRARAAAAAAAAAPAAPAAVSAAPAPAAGATAPASRSLFDGKSLGGWKSTRFGGEGPVGVEKGQLVLHKGVTLTGITWAGQDIPRMGYELGLEAMKLEGDDFFCGLTFPVGAAPCSLIVGGWGGSVVGLSSIDGMDASENQTTTSMSFPKNRWYRIRVAVTPARIQAWIDDKAIVDLGTKGRQFSIRPEVELSKPLGIATWMTTAALREIKIRPIDAPAGAKLSK